MWESVHVSALHTTAGVAAENTDLLVFLIVGILAGAHCLGMCGPLVTAYADRVSNAKPERRANVLSWVDIRQQLLFNLGRTASYAFVGVVFGLLGALAFVSSEAVASVGETVRGTTGILVGIAIIVSGVYYLRGRAGSPHGMPLVGPLFGRISAVIARRIDRYATSSGIVGLGAIHGVLPCPIIYPAYLYAFALGDPIRGGLALGVLGLGTIPTLLVYGTAIGSVTTTNRIRLHRVLGVAFLVLGYIPLQHGLMLYGVHLPHPPLPFYQPL